MGFPGGSVVKKKTHMPMQEVQVPSLEKEKAILSSILAWEIPWIEEPGGYSLWGRKSQTQLSN